MPTKGMKDVTGRIVIGDSVFEGPVTDFTYDEVAVEEYIYDYVKSHMRTIDGFLFTCPAIDFWTILKITGLWNWMIKNCPNKRVVYLMQHGSYRTRKKNWHRACSIISKMCTEVK